MSIILCMILSNSLLFFMFLIQRKLFQNTFSFHMQHTILKICLCLLLVPLPLLVIIIRIVLFYFFGGGPTSWYSNEQPRIVFAEQGVLLNASANRVVLFICLWFIIACAVMVYYIIPYIRFIRDVKKSVEPIEDETVIKLLHQKMELLNVKVPVELYQSNVIRETFTTGVKKPMIVVPGKFAYEDMDSILLHELTHIKEKDVLFRIICCICTVLYWFNPIIYVLVYFYDQTSELACDESAIQYMDNRDKKRYVQLILETADKRDWRLAHYASLFSNKLFFKERMDCIMKKDNLISEKKWYSPALAWLMVILSCTPALAAQTPQMMNVGWYVSDKQLNCDVEISRKATGSKYIEQPQKLLYDKQIVFENGKIISIDDFNHPEEASCNHLYESVVYTDHQRNGNGGCELENYEADVCSRCDKMINKTLVSKHSYINCPH